MADLRVILGNCGIPEGDADLITGWVQDAMSETSPVSPDALRSAYDCLSKLSASDRTALKSSIAIFSDKVRQLNVGPTRDFVSTYLSDRLNEYPSILAEVKRFSPLARDGAYLLLENGVSPDTFAEFINNPAVGSSENTILEYIALLYERGVTGFEKGFVRKGRDEGFLSADGQRINSLMAEYFQALWIASFGGGRVQLSPELAINWNNNPYDEYIDKNIAGNLPSDLKGSYRNQTSVTVDALATDGDGNRRIVEIKSSNGKYNPTPEEIAKGALQVFRHALLVRQHGLTGIEIVIDARDVSTEYTDAIIPALTASGVPFIVRLGDSMLADGGLRYAIAKPGSQVIPIDRTKELPFPKIRTNGDIPIVDTEAEDESWTNEVRTLLSDWIGDKSIKRLRSAQEFIDKLQSDLRLIGQDQVIGRIEKWIGDSELPSDRKEKLTRTLIEFRQGRQERLSATKVRQLIGMAEIATAEETGALPKEVSDDLKQYMDVNSPWLDTLIKSQTDELAATLEMVRESLGGELTVLDSALEIMGETDPSGMAVFSYK